MYLAKGSHISSIQKSWMMAYYMMRKISWMIHNDPLFESMITGKAVSTKSDTIAGAIAIIAFENFAHKKKYVHRLLVFSSESKCMTDMINAFTHETPDACFSETYIKNLKSIVKDTKTEGLVLRGSSHKNDCFRSPRCPFLIDEIDTIRKAINLFAERKNNRNIRSLNVLNSVGTEMMNRFKQFDVPNCIGFIENNKDPGFGFENKWYEVNKFIVQQ
jgi:hypothetical protein